MFLGLLITIVVSLLASLSVLLIYSLMLINVESRTFEIGVMRMLGFERLGIIQLLFVQSFGYSLPAIVLGLFSSQLLYYFGSFVLSAQLKMGSEIGRILDLRAITIAVVLGVVVPILAAILPIRKALSKDLMSSIDRRRSKVKVISFTITRSVSRCRCMYYII